MTRRWWLVGLLGLSPLLADASWQENTWLASASQASTGEPERNRSLPNARRPDGSTKTLRVASGDTLASLLRRLGADAETQQHAITTLTDKFDPRQLQPGNRVSLTRLDDGRPLSVAIERASGVRYIVTLDERPRARVVQPRTETRVLGREIVIESSLYAALASAALPTRFAADLEALLAGIMNVRRDLSGGERLQLLWQEMRRENGARVGDPRLTYAGLVRRAQRLEVVWPQGQGGPVMLFKDGKLQDTLRFPVLGARLTSPFGNRRHPVYGGVRRHDGIDLAAPRGTPVVAAASGRISFLGRRGGYGRVVELEHASGTISRYTHLSRFTPGLAVGDSVITGDPLGAVGASGLTTGPNLHYEVRVDDRPVDPLKEGQRLLQESDSPRREDYRVALFEARAQLQEVISDPVASDLAALDRP
ncbi:MULTISPECIES: M23 family metallopeptidase [Halomonadaceae]|uniref:Murein DD-endopeptidase MepM and murein hydrolase activator NlpD, contain LysM domain n=1 Tax=Modicisalibacter ilicicola DSM 19980 TaxID=1121942 RepID=A0A1M5CZM3_9GAMM|nr:MULTISPECIES: M23 family metallopeptidase [Halomonas]SHF60169.1 Murein DD-endopeptidase MepM and murein hydrolase activator NlpD, contain LysM domain [Halomonas ilicicola DSM 19980]